jgi:hypothetical protein
MYEILEAAVPYHAITSSDEVAKQVLNGLRLQKPMRIPPSDDLWTIMQNCWLEPDSRPSFQEIHQQLSLLLSSQPNSFYSVGERYLLSY